MKIRSILIALSLIALALPAIAQDVPQDPSRQLTIPQQVLKQVLPEPLGGDKVGPRLLEEQGYFWLSRHFTRPGDDGQGGVRDSNRSDLYMPWNLTNTQIRGYGQLFAPGMFYSFFRTVPNDTTALLRKTDGDPFNSIEYYQQFENAGAFTIDSMDMYWYKNPNNVETFAGAKFIVYRSPDGLVDKTYFAATGANSYRTRGADFKRSELPIVYETDITIEGIDSTINDRFINPTTFTFDPPLPFAAGSFAMPLIINDEAEAVLNPGTANDVRDFQYMGAFLNWRKNRIQGFGSGAGWKSMGIAVYRPIGEVSDEADTIESIWSRLGFTFSDGTRAPAHEETWMNFYGAVDISAGVKYHFGREASSQGLGNPTPNPVTVNTRIPFSLTESSDISIDLFDMNGVHVRSLVSNHYVPGNYSVALETGDLANGSYLVRMTAGETAYSMKVNVAR